MSLIRFPHEAGSKDSLLLCKLVEEHDQGLMNISTLVKTAESLSWYWKFVMSTRNVLDNAPNGLTQLVAKVITIPVASAIIAFCTALNPCRRNLSHSCFLDISEQQNYQNFVDAFSFSDYFDSDDSALQTQSDADSRSEQAKSRKLHHSLCRLVQCIGLVFCGVDDSQIVLTQELILSPNICGLLLPTLVVQCLTQISDFVLANYSAGNEKGIWGEYPFSFRSAGAQLDILLHKAYRVLHGINLSPYGVQSFTKEIAVPSTTTSVTFESDIHVKPSSAEAAAQLYRCVMRAYGNGRRTIPNDALEYISASLPAEIDNSERASAIKKFLFNNGTSNELKLNNMHEFENDSSLFTWPGDVDSIPQDYPMWVLKGDDNGNNKSKANTASEAMLVRKGMREILAKGSIPMLGSNIPASRTDASINSERNEVSQTESALTKKVNAIMDTVQHDSYNCERWFRAGLCFAEKANIILDRLERADVWYRVDDFFVPGFTSKEARTQYFNRGKTAKSLPILLREQYEVYLGQQKNKIEILGKDLSMFMSTEWSNFEGLKSFSKDFGASLSEDHSAFLKWELIHSKFDEGKFNTWQNDWGVIFVSALRKMSKRCFHIAFYLSTTKSEKENDRGDLYPEIAEALGTVSYSELMEGEKRGYPRSVLSDYEKRMTAKFSLECFSKALNYVTAQKKEQLEKGNVASWELHFMIGKVRNFAPFSPSFRYNSSLSVPYCFLVQCYEKIAATLQAEKYVYVNDTIKLRAYENAMSRAIRRLVHFPSF